MLQTNYNTREKIAELIDGGDISCLESDTDWERNEVPNHVLYYNARGERTEPRLDLNVDDYFEGGEEYAYIFTLDHTWECYALTHKYDDDFNVIQTNAVVKEIPSGVAVD